jgi:hypothetical protein
LRHALAAKPGDRVLHTHAQALERSVFDEIQPSAALAAPERDSDGRPAVATARVGLDPATSSRAGKAPVYVAPQSFVPGGGRRKRPWMLLALLAVLLVGGVAAGLATAGDDDSTVATATTEPPPLTTAGGVASIAPGPTVASTTLAPLPSVVIRTTFVRPVTTYTVVISGAAPSFTYAWRLIGIETAECAARMIIEGPEDRSVTWDHPHPPCAVGTDHADTVIEVVGTSATILCRFQGAAEAEQPCTVTRQ